MALLLIDINKLILYFIVQIAKIFNTKDRGRYIKIKNNKLKIVVIDFDLNLFSIFLNSNFV
jgi:hypothetical protein